MTNKISGESDLGAAIEGLENVFSAEEKAAAEDRLAENLKIVHEAFNLPHSNRVAIRTLFLENFEHLSAIDLIAVKQIVITAAERQDS